MKLFYAAILTAASAAAQTVEGRVINSLTGAGIPDAHVELVRAASTAGVDASSVQETIGFQAANGKTAYSAATDAQGRFRIEDIETGAYTARYRAQFYWNEGNVPGVRESIRPFQITATGTPVTLEARMIPMSTISGRVVDGGDIIPQARLDLIGGNLILGLNADADGKFFTSLFPGEACMLVLHPPLGWKPPDPDPESGRALAWATTYYPAVARRDAAMKIAMPPGVNLPDVEMKLLALPAHAVRGVLLNPDGTPAAKAVVTLGEDFFMPAFHTDSKPDGTFEIPAVVDGTWRVSADVDRGAVKMRAVEWVEMAGRDREDLKLRFKARMDVRGKVAMETPKGLPSPKPPQVRLAPVTPGDIFEPPAQAWPAADGNFVLEHVYPGVFRLDPLPRETASAYYLDAVRLGDADLAAPAFELSSGAVPLTFVYKTNGGAVRGTVEGCRSGGVVLVASDPAVRWPGLEHRARCDSNGRYETKGPRNNKAIKCFESA